MRRLSSDLARENTRKTRRAITWLVIALLVLGVFSLHIEYGTTSAGPRFYTPDQVLRALLTWGQLAVANIFQLPMAAEASLIIAEVPEYNGIITRFTITVITVLCGAMLALSGMLYQIVFRNPMAAPSLLGVSSGVTLGLLALTLQFGMTAVSMPLTRYLYCYGAGIVVLIIVLGIGFALGGGRSGGVFEMLLIGTVVSQLVGVISTYASSYLDVIATSEAYTQLTETFIVDTSVYGAITLAVTVVCGILPIIVLRFRMNALAFSDDEASLMGKNPRFLRVIALVCGSLVFLTAQIQVGSVSVFAMVVPFVARSLMGVEFSKQMWGSLLLGAIVLLICRDAVALIPFPGYGLPLSIVTSVIVLPLFIWIIVMSNKTWN